jgi:arylsulfatase A-like enzyme
LYLPFNAPHSSSALDPKIRSTIQAPKEFKSMYPSVEPEFDVKENYRYAAPATVATKKARTRDYRAAVTCMDASIGKVIERIEKKGLLDNTIIVFFSDNGGGGGSDNSPLRGKKGEMWEGGIRVPCLVRWPAGNIPAGTVNNAFLTSLELLPSFAAVAGADLQEKVTLDGYDWWQTLRGSQPSPREAMFWKRKGTVAARVDNWKWVRMRGTFDELFDLNEDIGEKNNLAPKQPEVLARIKRRYQAWRAEMEASEPRRPFRDF